MKNIFLTIIMTSVACNFAEAKKKKLPAKIEEFLPYHAYEKQLPPVDIFHVANDGANRWRNDHELSGIMTQIILKVLVARDRYKNTKLIAEKTGTAALDEINVVHADLNQAQILTNMLLDTHEFNYYVMYFTNPTVKNFIKTIQPTSSAKVSSLTYDENHKSKHLRNNDSDKITDFNEPRGMSYYRFAAFYVETHNDLVSRWKRDNQTSSLFPEMDDLLEISTLYSSFLRADAETPKNVTTFKNLTEKLKPFAEKYQLNTIWMNEAPFKTNAQYTQARLLHEIMLEIEEHLEAAKEKILNAELCDPNQIDKLCTTKSPDQLEKYLMSERLKQLYAEKIMSEVQYCNASESNAIKIDESNWGYHWWWGFHSELMTKAHNNAVKEFNSNQDDGWKAK